MLNRFDAGGYDMLNRFNADIMDLDRRMRKLHYAGRSKHQIYHQFRREGYEYETIKKHYDAMLKEIQDAAENEKNRLKLQQIAAEVDRELKA